MLHRLTSLIRRVENRLEPIATAVPTGWPDVDASLSRCDPATPGLRVSAVHEFLSERSAAVSGEPAPAHFRGRLDSSQTIGPACILSHLARQAAAQFDGILVWIGRRCWPSPQFLHSLGLLSRSLFVDASAIAQRVWAIELSARSPATAAVIADGENFRMPATRRLELAARAARGPVLLARPAADRTLPSAAMTRWLVRSRPSPSADPAWTLQLIRHKAGTSGSPQLWPVEWNRAQGAVIISAQRVDRLAASAASPKSRTG